ncbi:hypothetical protein Taro_042702 [Colocasia esculenta]|uniref:Uncharacterized protein n=1 Tax=Colocasia esculenta TaxID=4460 RepID=A0A843X028_COLES|nr:hypothetical protein [Colocasia esculenta]
MVAVRAEVCWLCGYLSTATRGLSTDTHSPEISEFRKRLACRQMTSSSQTGVCRQLGSGCRQLLSSQNQFLGSEHIYRQTRVGCRQAMNICRQVNAGCRQVRSKLSGM